MKELDFDIESIEKTNIDLLNCQIDLILRSLEFYCYTYQYIYPRRGKSQTEEENLRISLVRDTYPISKNLMDYSLIEKDFEKIA